MIFNGHLELQDINKYRNEAVKRYMSIFKENFTGLNQIELEGVECIERIFEKNQSLPFVQIITVDSDKDYHTYCELSKDGSYKIFLSANEVKRLQLYVEEIFGSTWSDLKIKTFKEQRGVEYNSYNKSIYDYNSFSFYESCKPNIVTYVFKMALWFIVLHEYAHVQNGHLKYKQAMEKENKPIPLNIQKAMEIQADITAAYYLLEIIFGFRKYIGIKQFVANGQNNPGISFICEVAFAIVSAYLSLRCFLKRDYWDEYTIPMHLGTSESHPLTEARMSIVFNIMLNGISKLFIDSSLHFKSACRLLNMIEDFENFYFENKNIGDDYIQKINYDPTKLLRTEEGKIYFNELIENLKELNDILVPYIDDSINEKYDLFNYDQLPKKMFWSK